MQPGLVLVFTAVNKVFCNSTSKILDGIIRIWLKFNFLFACKDDFV